MKSKTWILFLIVLLASPNLQAETYNLDQFLELVKKHSKDLKLATKEQ